MLGGAAESGVRGLTVDAAEEEGLRDGRGEDDVNNDKVE